MQADAAVESDHRDDRDRDVETGLRGVFVREESAAIQEIGYSVGRLEMSTVLGIIIGICLSAACGFRVFVPLLGLSIAALSGRLELSPGFEWIGTWPALIALATATVIEIGTYYIPWLDNVMDALLAPAAVVAGVIATASMVDDVSPFLKWALAIVAGGGVSAVVHGGTAAFRAGSSGTTGGSANFLVATLELVGSVLITILAVVLPVLCLVAVIWICYKMIAIMTRWRLIRRRAA